MKLYILIIIFLIIILLYLFYIKIKKGKSGRISGKDVEKKRYEDALVVDVRSEKEYAKGHVLNAINLPIKIFKNNSKILDNYKEKNIILYCVVDITSRNTEKILKDKGFKHIYIGDGIKQYNYSKHNFKNVLMAEMKYLRTILKYRLLNLGDVELDKEEIKCKIKDINELTLNKEEVIFVYSNKSDESLEASIILSKKGYQIINLIEPLDLKKYVFTTYNKQDFIDSKQYYKKGDCG